MKNTDGILRALRIALGAIILAFTYFWLNGTIQIIAYLAGAALAVAGFFGCCGFFTLFRLNVCSRDEKPLSPKATVVYLFMFLILLGTTGLISSFVKVYLQKG